MKQMQIHKLNLSTINDKRINDCYSKEKFYPNVYIKIPSPTNPIYTK